MDKALGPGTELTGDSHTPRPRAQGPAAFPRLRGEHAGQDGPKAASGRAMTAARSSEPLRNGQRRISRSNLRLFKSTRVGQILSILF